MLQKNPYLRLLYHQMQNHANLQAEDIEEAEDPKAFAESGSAANEELLADLLHGMSVSAEEYGARLIIVYHPGISIASDFNLPYISQSVTEFWRRWHISLSTWLKEYLYIPLGGNRKGKLRQYINLFLTMLLGGLWHGANWTFVFWGGLNGLALCVNKLLPKKEKSIVSQVLSIVGTICFISFTWIFFCAESFSVAWIVIKGILTLQNGIRQPFSWSFAATIILLISTTCAAIKNPQDLTATDGYYPILNLNRIAGLTIFFVTVGLILGLAYTGNNPFVYFQF